MNILFVTQSFYPVLGGGENYILYLGKALNKRGHKISVVTSRTDCVSSYVKIDGVDTYYCPHFELLGMPVVSPGLVYRIVRNVEPDIVHCSGPCITEDLGFLFSRISRIPVVTTYHADLNLEKAVSCLYMRAKNRLILRRMDAVIVTTSISKELLSSRKLPTDKIHVISDGVCTYRFKPAPNRSLLREVLGIPDKNIILFVGGLSRSHAYKRVDLLIRAVKLLEEQHQKIYLVVVGNGNLMKFFEELVRSLSINHIVSFRNNVDDDTLPNYYTASDVFVLPSPSQKEGFGLVLLEAMACGCPVVTTSGCGGAEIVRQSQGGLLATPYDVYDLADKISAILNNSELRARLGKQGERFAQSYDWRIIAEKMEEVYRNVLSKANTEF